MNNNIHRQIKDIQVQADRLLNTKPNLEDIKQFKQYADELKTFLISNVNDDFILNYLNEFPDIDLNRKKSNNSILLILLSFFSGSPLGASYREQDKVDQALETIKEIRNKYSSSEFMLKNYFS